MSSPLTLSVLAGSLLASVALGIHLGESSIAQINPVYFQDPPPHPRDRGAAIEEGSLARMPTAYSGLYGWDEGQAALSADCGDCAALRARNANAYSARVPYFGSGGDLHAAVAEARTEHVQDSVEVPEALSPRQQQIGRYASYPVTVEAPQPAAPGVAEATPDAPAPTPGKADQE